MRPRLLIGFEYVEASHISHRSPHTLVHLDTYMTKPVAACIACMIRSRVDSKFARRGGTREHRALFRMVLGGFTELLGRLQLLTRCRTICLSPHSLGI